MYGLRFRYRPIDEVIREIEECGERVVALNDADFFGHTGDPGTVPPPLPATIQIEVAERISRRGDGMEVRINDAPRANEIMVAIAVTDSGRPLPRVGGLEAKDAEGNKTKEPTLLESRGVPKRAPP